MADRTQESRGRRSAARERRRSRTAEPSERPDRAEPSAESEEAPQTNGAIAGGAAKIVGTAFAAGLLGALGGAAKALLEGRGHPKERAESDESSGRDSAPEAATRKSKPAAEEPRDDEETEQPGQPEAAEREQPEPEREQPEPAAGAPDREDGDAGEEVVGVSDGDAAEVVAKARRQLEGLLERDVERVSGFERSGGRWTVTLEVVEVPRVPDSTDVMATYAVVLDDQGNLVSVNLARRYRRSQVDDRA